ncbi:hypothetical protein BTM182_16120 [Helicobacter pylori]
MPQNLLFKECSGKPSYLKKIKNRKGATKPRAEEISRRTTESSSSTSEQIKPWDEKQRKLKKTGKQDTNW